MSEIVKYDYIVVGCGGIGSAAMYWLSKRSKSVLGIEQFHLGHDNGGSQDHSRIVRLSYDAPEYTALAPYSYTAFRDVEAETGLTLLVKTGIIVFGSKHDSHVQSYAKAMRAQGIPFEEFGPKEMNERFPQFKLGPEDIGLYQADGGFVNARQSNAAHIIRAKSRGATILENTKVQKVVPIGKTGAQVITNKGTFECKKLIVTSGSWTNDVLKGTGVQIPITVTQEQVTYYQTPHIGMFVPSRFPVWIAYDTTPDGKTYNTYGIPIHGEIATKAGVHEGGIDVPVTGDTRTFTADAKRVENLTKFLSQKIPDSLGPILYTKTCLYDLTPDRNFVIDTLPEFPQIAVVVGSGHAYKFAGLLGLICSQIAVDGSTPYPIQPFTIKRPALQLGKSKL